MKSAVCSTKQLFYLVYQLLEKRSNCSYRHLVFFWLTSKLTSKTNHLQCSKTEKNSKLPHFGARSKNKLALFPWKYLKCRLVIFLTTNGSKLGLAVYLSSGKNSIITFQHILIQLVWKNTRLLHLSLALYSDFRGWRLWQGLFSRARVFLLAALRRVSKQQMMSLWAYWLLRQVMCSKTGFWWLDKPSSNDTVSRLKSNWDGPVYTAAT